MTHLEISLNSARNFRGRKKNGGTKAAIKPNRISRGKNQYLALKLNAPLQSPESPRFLRSAETESVA